MEKRRNSAILVVGVLVALSTLYLSSLVAVPPARQASNSVSDLSASRYFDQVKYLAADEMKGRGDGSPELDKAADYIASQFRTFGLRPMGDNGSFFQNFEVTTGAAPGTNNELQLNSNRLKLNEDFV